MTNKLIVTLLIITILLSVITIGVTVTSHVDKTPSQTISGDLEDSSSANVGLTIVPNADAGVSNETE